MNKYRLKFSKIGKIKYTGHLDLLKIFQRAIKRANLPISYSQGFNPHQIMSFAIPLPLGMESEAEYIDMQFDEDLTPEYIKDTLNKDMPIGMEILNVVRLKEGQKSAPSIVCIGEYEILLNTSINKNNIEDFLSQKEINIERITKKRGKEITKTVNIREDIFSIQYLDSNKIKATISTGSAKNLKPDVLIERLYNFLNIPYEKYKINYKRVALFDENKIQLDFL
ncbi:TIGR03936 family radical SAM-associated protein [uncultured Tyzzerella sp.]|uniref:TIGR03936 family radical SAM-associated protein n=1 Tax=uncultured Tyzzerella sp. TaxID=2321398 RepID=UPI002942614E|nr:TIGR03936 family radical SAM-associated protein [uncultured Tyzzerella sp.]